MDVIYQNEDKDVEEGVLGWCCERFFMELKFVEFFNRFEYFRTIQFNLFFMDLEN